MAQFEKHFVQDLTQDIKIRQCGTIVFNGDNLSNVITVDLYNGTEPYSGGGSVSCSVICPDGATVPITNGSISGNTVTVTLTGDCFALPGQIGVGVQVVSGDIRTTILKAIYNVELLETDTIVDPGSRITASVGQLVSDIENAVAQIPASDMASLMAGIAPTFSASTNYTAGAYVYYNGTLYRFTADHAAGSWTGTDATAVALGNDLGGQISDLKSAIGSWTLTKEITNSRYPYFELPAANKFYFKLLSVGTGTLNSISVRGVSGGTATDIYSPSAGETEFTFDVYGSYDTVRVQLNLTASVSTTISVIFHAFDGGNYIEDTTLINANKIKKLEFDIVNGDEKADLNLVVGGISPATGADETDPDNRYFRSTGYIPFSGKTYIIYADPALTYNIVFYDSSDARYGAITNITGTNTISDSLFTGLTPVTGIKFRLYGRYSNSKKNITIDDIIISVFEQPKYPYYLSTEFYPTDGVFYSTTRDGLVTQSGSGYCVYSPIYIKAGHSYELVNVLAGRCYVFMLSSGIYLKIGSNATDVQTVVYTPEHDCVLYITTKIENKPVIVRKKDKIITVKKDGTGDFDSIYAAVSSITDSSENNQYEIQVHEGVYDAIEEVFGSGPYSAVEGIVLPPYVHLVGIGQRDNIILKAEFPNTVSLGVSTAFSTINVDGTSRLENMTFIAYNCRYACHDDDGNAERAIGFVRTVKNCKFWHKGQYTDDGSVWKWTKAYGQGLSSGSTSIFINCEFVTDTTINGNCAWSTHGHAGMTSPSYITHIGCKFVSTHLDLCATTNGLNDGVEEFVRYEGCEFSRSIGTGNNVEINKEQYSSNGVYFIAYGIGNKNCYPGVGRYASGQQDRLHFFANDNL